MSFYFSDSPRLSDRLRGMADTLRSNTDRSNADLLREMKQKFKADDDAFFEPGRSSRDSFKRPSSRFPRGFPFDDADIFEHPRGDGIRAHLDDLATRHPELAEHLRGPPWPFGNSLRRDCNRRRRGSGGNDSDGQQQGQQHQVDEDTRSQASGSSAASGASAVSSHSSGEPDLTSSIPQYGLRNTVDIGQQQRRRDMETNSEKDERGQRSMSAPPENRQQQQGQGYQQQQQPQPGQGQRFVSRVDITPQHNQQRSQSPGKPPSNVRHIPIFVEGRDEPVIPKLATDDTPSSAFSQRQPSPPRHFHRPSHFNEHFSKQQWPPSHFQNVFYEPAGFDQPTRRQQQQQPQHHQPQYHQQYQQPPYQQQQQQPQQSSYHYPQQQQSQYHQQPPQQQQPPQSQYYQQPSQQQPQQQQQQQEIPKPKPPMPKDPLERVALVQKEVDNLAEQVRRYAGGSRQDKDYMYLDEMLTRELIKLDDIETEGRENVRQARKNAIKSIQDTISLLETKAPLAGQPPAALEEKEKCSEETSQAEVPESVGVNAKQEKQSGEPIPLPPAPSSPIKTKVESSEKGSTTTIAETAANQNIVPAVQQSTDMDVEQKVDNCSARNTEQPVAVTSTTHKSTKSADEVSKESKPTDSEQRKDDDSEATTIKGKDAPAQLAEEAKKEKTQTDGGQRSSTESPRLQKKAKKASKQQQPVSEEAIPLPPPPPAESAK